MSKDLKKQRAEWELTLEILKTINNFKSKEEPDVELTINDKVRVLASIIVKKL